MSQELTQFNALKSDVSQFVTPTLAMTVTSLATSQKAVEACQQVKAYLKEIESKRKELTDPLLAEQRRIKAYADDIKEPLERAEIHLKRQIAVFDEQQEVLRAAERRKAEEIRLAEEAKARAAAEEAAAELRAQQEKDRAREQKAAAMFGEDETEGEPQESIEVRQAKEQAELQFRLDQEAAARTAAAQQREWDIKQQGVKGIKKLWKCEVTDISKVPDAFLVKTLNESMVLAAARGGQIEIPGVRIWQETSVSIGRNTYVPRAALEKEKAGA